MRTVAIAVLALLGCKDKNTERPSKPQDLGEAVAKVELPTEAEYATLLIAELKKHGAKEDLKFDPEKSMITGGDRQIATTNLYAEYKKVPAEQRAAEIARVGKSMGELGDDADEQTLDQVRAKLLPAVRAGMYFDWQLQSKLTPNPKADKHHAVFVPLGELTGAGVAIDGEESMMIATDSQLEKWGLTVEQALAIATTNLAAKGTPFRSVQPGLWTSPAHDNYDSARLFLFDEIKKLGLKGTVVAVIPNRDTLYLASANDATALLAMADLAEKASEEPRPIHTVPLCLSGTTWSDCEPGPTPQVKERMHALATSGRASLYSEQKEPLQAKVGEDVFVASFTVLQQSEDGKRVISYATWSRTVPTLLPHADMIGFVEMTGGDLDAKPRVLGMVPWGKAMQILRAHMKPDGRNPPRWATGDYWPTAAELAKLAPRPDPFE